MDDTADAGVTADVGSEGGSSGDVELVPESEPATGSEGGETWQPADDAIETIVRGESGRKAPASSTSDD